MKKILLKKNGENTSLKATIRVLEKDDLEEMLNLQSYIHKDLKKKSLFSKDSEQFILYNLEKGGIAYGVFDQNKLIAYAILHFPKDKKNNLGLDINLPKKELNNVAHLETQIVHPNYRGNGLQTLLNKTLIKIAKEKNFFHILATVSPDNKISHENLEKIGLHVVTTKIKYGNKKRDIMHMKIK